MMFVSVVLPVRNEEAHIRGCLENLLAQDYPKHMFEILVVDGMSTDNTRAVVQEMAVAHPEVAIRLLENPAKIVPPALNIGIRAAQGEVVVRMDGHTVPAPSYISACVRALEQTQAANVGGLMQPVGDTPFGEAVALAQSHRLGVGDAKFHYSQEPAYVDTVYMGAFRKAIFEKAGLFDESMVRNQDYEMNIRIRKAGGKIYLDPHIQSTYAPRNTPQKLWRQYFQYGWWRVETLRRHPDSLRWRQFLPAFFVFCLIFLGLTSPFLAVSQFLLAAQLGLYGLAIMIATIDVIRKPNLSKELRSRILLFPLSLVILHISWGAGFLLSLLSRGRYPYSADRPRVPLLAVTPETKFG
jgi:succinoglycan biosynthesis protein ExoA